MKINVYLALVILLAAAAVLNGISIAVHELLPSPAYPQWLWGVVNGLKYVFATSAVAPLFTIVRNLYGYLRKKYEGNEQVEYEGRRLFTTWLTYEGYIKGIGIGVLAVLQGTPYYQYSYFVAGSLAFVVDLIRSSLSEIAGSKR